MSKPHYTKTLEIPQKDLAHYEKLLAGDYWNYDDLDVAPLTTIKMWTVKFDDGCFIDLKVNSNCREDGDFYAEIVLFDADGCQLDFSDAQYDLKGEWNAESRDAWYTIEVKGV